MLPGVNNRTASLFRTARMVPESSSAVFCNEVPDLQVQGNDDTQACIRHYKHHSTIASVSVKTNPLPVLAIFAYPTYELSYTTVSSKYPLHHVLIAVSTELR
jgi:hypothetical protein